MKTSEGNVQNPRQAETFWYMEDSQFHLHKQFIYSLIVKLLYF